MPRFDLHKVLSGCKVFLWSLFNSCPDHRNFFLVCAYTHVVLAQCDFCPVLCMSITGYVSAAPCCLGRRSSPSGAHMHGCKEFETSVRLFLSLKLVFVLQTWLLKELSLFDECNGMFVMPPTDPWRSFHIQAIHSKEKIQHFIASHVFSLAVSIFSASSPTMLREVVPRNVVLHTDGRLFAHYILDVLNVCLAKRRVPSDLWPKLQCIAELLILWFFPDSHISHRTCAHLEVLMAVVFASRSILWLRTHHWTEQAKRVLRVLPPEECTVLKFGIGSNVETNTSCLQRHVDRQRHLIDGPPLVFGLYQYWCVSWRYVGIGKHQRKMHPSQGGLSRRFLEHMCGTIRSRYRESFKLRYRLSRRSVPWSSFFMVLSYRLWGVGSCLWVRWMQGAPALQQRHPTRPKESKKQT